MNFYFYLSAVVPPSFSKHPVTRSSSFSSHLNELFLKPLCSSSPFVLQTPNHKVVKYSYLISMDLFPFLQPFPLRSPSTQSRHIIIHCMSSQLTVLFFPFLQHFPLRSPNTQSRHIVIHCMSSQFTVLFFPFLQHFPPWFSKHPVTRSSNIRISSQWICFPCMYMYVCVCMCVCMYMYVYVYVYICICIYICVYMCMYACIYICVCVYICVLVCVCVYIYIWVKCKVMDGCLFLIKGPTWCAWQTLIKKKKKKKKKKKRRDITITNKQHTRYDLHFIDLIKIVL